PLHQRAPQARIVERAEPLLAVAPVLQAADHHRAVDQIDHRTGPEGGDHLALPDLPVRLAVGQILLLAWARHQYLSSSCVNRSQIWVLGSTTRIEVGATK